jgi:hypothetical protein
VSLTRLSKTQRAMLEFLAEGRGQIYSGSRSWGSNRAEDRAHCNEVSLYFVRTRGWIERVESNLPGWWWTITDRGREVLSAGKFNAATGTPP